jgi:pimeloyl-ACP methyl ester carboxylesterase
MDGASIENIGGLEVEILRRGRGRPVLFLHPHIGFWGAERFVEALAAHAEVIAPSHPGFGRSQLAKGMTTVDDLSYFYLDLMEQLDLREVVLVGASFGGWLAAEIATKSCERLARLVMIGAVGVKLGAREKTDVIDIFATPRARWEEVSFHDPAFGRRDYASLSDEELAAMARNREATALFAWNPYMYDPKLPGRLHRVRVPTLFLWGASDRFAPPGYGRGYCAAIPGATFEEIAEAGHFPHIEQAGAVAARVLEFAATPPRRGGEERMER